jgi:hypothetical protein
MATSGTRSSSRALPSTRTMSLRVMVGGLAVVAAGVLLLFLPIRQDFRGTGFDCGSAAVPRDVPTTVCSFDGMRFAAVSTLSGGALLAVVAGLWPTLRGNHERSPEPWEPGWRDGPSR